MNINCLKFNSKYPLSLGIIDDCLILSFPNIEKSEPYPSSYLDAAEDLFKVLLNMDFNKWVLDLRNVSMIYNDLFDLISLFPDNKVIAVSSNSQKWDLGAEDFGAVVVSPRLYTNNLLFPPEFIMYLEEYIGFGGILSDFLIEYPEWSNFNIDLAAKGIRQSVEHANAKFQEILYNKKFPDFSNTNEIVKYLRSIAVSSTSKLLSSYFDKLAYQSPLIQMAIESVDSELKCKILHTGAGYRTKTESNDILITKPAIICNKTSVVLNKQIIEFEYLLNDPTTKENDFQNFFEQNKNFLLGSEYEALYPQIVLEQEDGSLIPDFFLQPAVIYPWADILDLKLPTEKLVVGSDNRRRLSQAVSKGIAQLREYEAYFENPINRDKIYKTVGIRCYKPKLNLVIGRYSKELNELNIRREISSYQNFRILTYDDLLEHAKRRLLL